MIEPMSLASVAAGANGLMIEVHDRPEEAMLDKEQAIDIEQFKRINEQVKTLRETLYR